MAEIMSLQGAGRRGAWHIGARAGRSPQGPTVIEALVEQIQNEPDPEPPAPEPVTPPAATGPLSRATPILGAADGSVLADGNAARGPGAVQKSTRQLYEEWKAGRRDKTTSQATGGHSLISNGGSGRRIPTSSSLLRARKKAVRHRAGAHRRVPGEDPRDRGGW